MEIALLPVECVCITLIQVLKLIIWIQGYVHFYAYTHNYWVSILGRSTELLYTQYKIRCDVNT